MARAAFRAEADGWDARDLVFLDETSTPTTLTPLRARAPRGERAVGTVPRGRWEQATLICALTPEGMAAPMLRPGQVVLLDNRSVHTSATARRLVAEAGCELRHLPTSSPDMNPIEQAFAKVKAGLRRAAARDFDALVAAATPAPAAVTPADARGFSRDAGYPLADGQPL